MVVLSLQVASAIEHGGPAAPSSRRSRVLVVDDEADIRDAIRALLEDSLEGVTVLTAPDGPRALEILRAQAVDLILTDFKMPGMNGLEFIQEAMKVSPRTPRILITAFERDLAQQASVQRAFSHVFTKPLNPRPLLQTCQRMLAQASW